MKTNVIPDEVIIELDVRTLPGETSADVDRHLAGAVAYGAGLLSPAVTWTEFLERFHGHDERVDVDSLALATQLWIDVATDLLA